MTKNSLSTLLGAIIVSMISVQALYHHKIEPFSFDLKKFEYPLEYHKWGTAVALRRTIKLLPKVENRYGGLWLSQPVETNMFELAYRVILSNSKNTATRTGRIDDELLKQVDDIEGFALWYLNHEPKEADMRAAFGFKADYNGIGVYMFKHRGTWRIMSIYNQGLEGLTVEAAVNNLTTPDNHCLVYAFDGGAIDVKFRVLQGNLSVDYNVQGDGQESSYEKCISEKAYPGLQLHGHVGITSGNPVYQNVNEVDVEKIDFYNMNSQFYQHDAAEVVAEQEYYQKDGTGFTGKVPYPYSAKLSTIEMGKVAFDVLEMKRHQREYLKEQFTKSLHIVHAEDDLSEVIFKLFEQMRLMNDDLKNHLSIQDTKRDAIKELERILMTEEDYRRFLAEVKGQDNTLIDISQKFAELSREAKRILDDVKDKSQARKAEHGVEDDAHYNEHHRYLPQHLIDKLQASVREVEELHLVFKGFQGKTNEGITTLHESKERVVKMRQESSLSGNRNVFDRLQQKHDQIDKEVFGDRGYGIYQDSVLQEIEKIVSERTDRLEKVIRDRQASEQFISTILTIAAVCSIGVVYLRVQRFVGKGTFLGGFGVQRHGPGSADYVI